MGKRRENGGKREKNWEIKKSGARGDDGKGFRFPSPQLPRALFPSPAPPQLPIPQPTGKTEETSTEKRA